MVKTWGWKMTALGGEVIFLKDRWVIMYPVLSTKQQWVAPAASPVTLLHTHKPMHTPNNAHCNTYVFVWIEQVSSSVLALLCGSEQQRSVDAFRHNSSTSDSPSNSPSQLRTRDYKTQYDQCVPDSCKYPLKGLKGRIRFLLFNILRGAAHIVPHPLRQLLRLKSCPTSNYDDRIPDHLLREQTVMFAFPLAVLSRNPSVPNGRQNTRTHPKSAVSVCRIVTSGEQQKPTNGFANCAADASAAARYSSRRCSLLVRLCARRDGIQGVADRMLQEEHRPRTSAFNM